MGEILAVFVGLVVLINISRSTAKVGCGSHFTTESGSLQSPGYPKPYPPDQYCVWTISIQGTAPRIILRFSAFDLPPPTKSQCTDYVVVYQGMLQRPDNQIAKFCGSSIPSDILVKKKSLRIEFVSNLDYERGEGFVASFSATSNSAITTSQATAGIVAAIFCGVVFIGVGAMRCIMMGACQRCQQGSANQRECVGSDDMMGGYEMAGSPPDYVTVMAHPERYPTPNASPHSTPGTARGLMVRDCGASMSLHSDNDDGDTEDEDPPPYPGIMSEGGNVNGLDRSDVHVEISVPVQINNNGNRCRNSRRSNGQNSAPNLTQSTVANRRSTEATVASGNEEVYHHETYCDEIPRNDDRVRGSDDRIHRNDVRNRESDDRIYRNDDRIHRNDDRGRENEDGIPRNDDRIPRNDVGVSGNGGRILGNGTPTQSETRNSNHRNNAPGNLSSTLTSDENDSGLRNSRHKQTSDNGRSLDNAITADRTIPESSVTRNNEAVESAQRESFKNLLFESNTGGLRSSDSRLGAADLDSNSIGNVAQSSSTKDEECDRRERRMLSEPSIITVSGNHLESWL